jgi:hypothetical protein
MTNIILKRLSEKYKVDADGCWVWFGAKGGKHKWVYGIMLYKKKMTPAHRIAYEELRGPIPEGLDLDHLCRNTLCVNPWHCEPVTHQENIRRGYDLKPHKTHCIHGHALTAENVYVKTRKGRDSWECRTCRARQCAVNYSKRKKVG